MPIVNSTAAPITVRDYYFRHKDSKGVDQPFSRTEAYDKSIALKK